MYNLSDVVAELRTLQGTVSVQRTDHSSGTKVKKHIPRYLFRGENYFYPNTHAGAHRFVADPRVTGQAKREIVDVMDRLREHLASWVPEKLDREALLQHYGFPTLFVDLTSSVEVAAHFAVDRNKSELGRILVCHISQSWAQKMVVDLTGIDWAIRPQRQHAYLVNVGEDGDLQRLPWVRDYRFIVTDTDSNNFCRPELVGDLKKDPTCGLLHLLAGYTDERDITEEAREWLEERIPWAPVPMEVDRDTGLFTPHLASFGRESETEGFSRPLENPNNGATKRPV